MYIASIGKAEIRMELPNGTPLPMPTSWFYAHTGVIWKITFTGETAATGAAEAKQEQAPPLSNNQTTIGNAITTNAIEQEVDQFLGGAEEATTTAGTEEGTTTTPDGNGNDEEDNEQGNGE